MPHTNIVPTSTLYPSYASTPASPHIQRGASVSGIVFFILALGIIVKLAVATVPAQISDYQLTKAIALELKKANDNQEPDKIFMKNLENQLRINADYETNPNDILTFTNKNTGNLAVHKKYEVVNNFFGNVDIVTRFEGDITAADAAQ